MFGEPDSHRCTQALQKFLTRCAVLGVPGSPGKMEGPGTKLVFLGIEINSVAETLLLSDPFHIQWRPPEVQTEGYLVYVMESYDICNPLPSAT